MVSAVIESPRQLSRTAPRPSTAPLTVRDVLTPVFYFRRRAMLALLAPLLIALFAALVARPVYVAEARLLILPGEDYVFRSRQGPGAPDLTFDRAQIVNAEMQILGSRELQSAALSRLGVDRAYPGVGADGLAKAVDQLQRDLTIQNIPQSNIIELQLEGRDPTVAAALLNELIGAYVARRREVFEQADPGSVNSQRDEVAQRLAEVERRIAELAAQHRLGDYEQELAAVQTRQAALHGQLESLDQQLALRSGRAGLLKERSGLEPEQVELGSDRSRSLQLQLLNEELATLQQQRAKFVDGSDVAEEYDRRIAALRAQIAAVPSEQVSVVRRGANPVRQQLEAQLADAEAEAVGLRRARSEAARALAEVNARLAQLVEVGPSYRALVRSRQVLEESFADLAKRSEQARVASSLAGSQANVRVLERAEPPSDGRTGRLLLLAAGLAAGLLAAAAVIAVSVALFEGMLTPRDVEQKLGRPVVLAVSEDEDDPAPAVEPTGLPAPLRLDIEDVKLLGRLLDTVSVAPMRTLQMIGPAEGVGVSSLILDVALAVARGGGRVLVLDLGARNGHSAADLLAARGAHLEPVAGGRLARVAGSALHLTLPMQGRELVLNEDGWETLLAEARKYYELVLVDAPPLNRSSLGLIVAPSVDMTLAVVEAETTRASVAQNTIERIETAGGHVVGAIFNKRRFYIPQAIYGWF